LNHIVLVILRKNPILALFFKKQKTGFFDNNLFVQTKIVAQN